MTALDRLASLFRIADDYVDVWGKRRTVTAETKLALLAAMGVTVERPDDIEPILDDRFAQRRRAVLPSVQVLTAGRAGAIALTLPPTTATVAWRVTQEHGAVSHGIAVWSDLAPLSAPAGEPAWARETRALPIAGLAAGYATLSIEAGERTAEALLVVAPERCWLPPEAGGSGGRMWGLAVQLYGLRSARNWGIGDFTDLAELARRAAALGAQAIGINPLHALFPEAPARCSPYTPSSRLFLNPLYLDVERIDGFAACAAAHAAIEAPAFRARLEAVRAAALVDYEGVAALKHEILELLFEQFRRAGDHTGLAEFRAARGRALEAHATFDALSEQRGGVSPGAAPDPAAPAVREFADRHADRVTYFAWLQWQADRQLAAAQASAREAGMTIGIYRDLAVGADPAGAEVWLDPARYAGDVAIGAPPDLFNPIGQNWGLSPLRPDRLTTDRFAAVIELLRANMAHAGALRIDHAFALMRLYWVPAGTPPALGAYVGYPFETLLAIIRLESWRHRCVVIGEDLGTVPAGFREACMAAGVLSYRLLYFERTEDGGFAAPADYPEWSLAAASTHDLPTVAGWWRASDIDLRESLGLYPSAEQAARDRAERARDRQRLADALAAQDLGGPEPPEEAPLIAIQRYLARSRAALLMIQPEDVLGLVEQANLPGTIDQHPNWRRKLPVDIDDLTVPGSPLATVAAAVNAERPRRPAALLDRPAATYRIQLNKDFTFHDAAALVPYLATLGISHLYCSPYLTARPGSPHGYDTTDHDSFNPELGGEAGFHALVAALERHDMGHVLDFVPNHMGIGADNPRWLDVLEWGEASRFAGFFDIDWRAGSGKLVLPILGKPCAEVLAAGELRLAFDADAGSFSLWYFDHRLPVCPADYPALLEPARAALDDADPVGGALGALIEGFAARRPADDLKRRLARLVAGAPTLARALESVVRSRNGAAALQGILATQHYRPVSWRDTAEINYRRFFDINDLAALRMESRAVFEDTHRLVFRLIEAGFLHGLRLDHVDGLADPAAYCRALRARIGAAPYLVVEKILGAHESLPAWPVAGTTGYDVLNQINGVFVVPAGEPGLDRIYRRFTGRTEPFDAVLHAAKRQLLESSFRGELERLARDLARFAAADPATGNRPLDACRRVVLETIAWFPVYRTYVTADEITDADRHVIEQAIGKAAGAGGAAEADLYALLGAVLTGTGGAALPRDDALAFVTRFQQLTGPAMAKGLEDTSFYRYHRLVSLNEVGGDPRRFGLSIAAFHALNRARLARLPDTLVATATHDTKRGEDVRARLNLLSEMPAAWAGHVMRWARLNRSRRRMVDGRPAPTRNDEYLIYQTLLGSWPLALKDDVRPGPALEAYLERLIAFLVKAMREAKESSSWSAPNQPYERAVTGFVRALLDVGRADRFLAAFLPFQQRIAALGMINGLAQLVLKLTIPGVPDIYQGTEFWDLSLVDPDNRRPVDFARRRASLADGAPIGDLLGRWPDGAIKQRILGILLRHRAAHRALYAHGAYRPLSATGARADPVLAFERRGEDGEGDAGDAVIVVVPVRVAGLVDHDELPVGTTVWRDTAIPVRAGRPWRDVLSGAIIESAGTLRIGEILSGLPVACLEPADARAGGLGGRSTG